jgi:hypothetical protein
MEKNVKLLNEIQKMKNLINYMDGKQIIKENTNPSLVDILKRKGDLNHLKGMDVIVINGEHKGEKATFHEYKQHEPIKNGQGKILKPAESLVSLTFKHSNIHSDIKPEDLVLDVEGFNAR